MSGALETAASAFAIVGVVDVLIRSCREVFGFLSEVKDAPENITKLSMSISDTIQLSRASKLCLDKLHVQPVALPNSEAILTLESAIKALNRETHALKVLIAKYKGNKTWSRVKYVLSDIKIKKATTHLEANKSVLSAALTLACNEMSVRGHTETEIAVRQCLQTVNSGVQSLAKTLDQSFAVQTMEITAKLDVNHDKALALQSRGHQSILSTIATQHDIHRKGSASNQQAIISQISSASLRVIAHQKELRRLAKQNCHHGSVLNQKVAQSVQGSRRRHDETKHLIAALTSEIRQLRMSTGPDTSAPSPYDRDIIFFGQHSDMIMTYLLPMQHDLNQAIESLMTHQGRDISINHAFWLQKEFGRLIASAAQENATRFPGSTARSIDQWSYPTQANGGTSIVSERKRKATESLHRHGNLSGKRAAIAPRSYVKPSNQLWSMETPSGAVHISLPPAQPEHDQVPLGSEVGASWMITQNCSTFAVSAQFRNSATGTMLPRVQTQLSVFTRVNQASDTYWHLFDTGTISEIDFAYRNGSISPFHVDDKGSNYYFEAAISRVRPDALLYLLNHGIHTSQIIRALDPAKSQQFLEHFLIHSEFHIIHNPKMRSLVELISEEVSFPSSIFANVALTLCIQAYARRDWGRAWTLFISCGKIVLKERPDLKHDLTKYWLIGDEGTSHPIWENVPPRQLLALMFAAGANPKNTYTGNRDATSYFMFLRFSRRDLEYCETRYRIDTDLLSALLEHIPPCQRSFSEARLSKCWDEWYDAFQCHRSKTAKSSVDTEVIACTVDFEDSTEVCLPDTIRQKLQRSGYYYTDEEDSSDDDYYDYDESEDSSEELPIRIGVYLSKITKRDNRPTPNVCTDDEEVGDSDIADDQELGKCDVLKVSSVDDRSDG